MSSGVGVRSQVSTTGIRARQQLAAAIRGMIDPGQEDGVGPPAEDGRDKPVLGLLIEPGGTQQDLVAGVPHVVAEIADGFRINQVGDRRHDGRDQARYGWTLGRRPEGWERIRSG